MGMSRAVWLAAIVVASVWMVTPADAADATVQVGSNYFSPESVTINRGQTVRWDFVGGVHDVVAGTPSNPGEEWCARSGSGRSCERSFSTAGSFAYFCSIHPGAMQAEVLVLGDSPTITIASPQDGASVSDIITIAGAATADPGIGAVDVRVDGAEWMPATGLASWSFSLDTNTLTNAEHSVEARVTSMDAQEAFASIVIVSANAEVVDFAITGFSGSTDLFGQPRIVVAVANEGSFLGSAQIVFEYWYDGAWRSMASFTRDIAGGESITQSYRWSDIGHFGEFQIRAVADPAGVVTEVREDNNEATSKAAFFTNRVGGISLQG